MIATLHQTSFTDRRGGCLRADAIGASPAWEAVVAAALRVAATEATVLLQGESGTGKEVIARLIHQASPRQHGPFVAINCAALPEQLLESELFGYERGAFTGAQQSKAGHIELAARGVLFLDEVSEMSLTAQVKFLRFLQERDTTGLAGYASKEPTCGSSPRPIATLTRPSRAGRFATDLLYRLCVFDIALPPLRQRRGDIPLLADQFIAELARSIGRRAPRLSDSARDALVAHSWPGNVRELRNVLERAVILADDDIECGHLSFRTRVRHGMPPSTLPAVERSTIERILRETAWNKSKAARRLGISRTQLYGRLRRYGLEAPAGDGAFA